MALHLRNGSRPPQAGAYSWRQSRDTRHGRQGRVNGACRQQSLAAPARVQSADEPVPDFRNCATCSLMNLPSAGDAPAPAGCPHKDGIGTN